MPTTASSRATEANAASSARFMRCGATESCISRVIVLTRPNKISGSAFLSSSRSAGARVAGSVRVLTTRVITLHARFALCERTAFDHQLAARGDSTYRQAADRAHVLHARNRREPFGKLPVEVDHPLLARRVLRVGQRDIHRQKVFGLEAGFDVRQTP